MKARKESTREVKAPVHAKPVLNKGKAVLNKGYRPRSNGNGAVDVGSPGTELEFAL